MKKSRCIFPHSQVQSLSPKPWRFKGACLKISGQHIWYMLSIALFFSLSGCAGIQYADGVQAADIAQLDKKETTTRVLAVAEEWRNSGARLNKGLKYKITATGHWTAGTICGWTGPDGLGVSSICSGAAGTFIGRGSASLLLGKIGESGVPFLVGNGLELTAPEDGILFFRINDTPTWMGENSGSVDVTTSLAGSSVGYVVKNNPPTESVSKESPAGGKEERKADKLPLSRPDTFAIVIGITYKGRQDIPNLQYPSNDAKRIYKIFIDPRYGGVPKENALLLLNEKATRSEMIAALRKIKTWDGYVYVYYSGHGAPKIKGDRFIDGFLVPYDVVVSDPDALEDTSIKISYIQDLIEESQAKGVMVAIDACFSGGGKSIVAKGGKPLVGMLVTSELIKPQSTGKVIITSSATNQQSWEDETEIKGGIFSYYLLEGLSGKAGRDVWVKVNELADFIKENVPKAARKLKGVEQTPQVTGNGDFAVVRNWERAKVADVEIAKSKLKGEFEKGNITVK